MMTLEEVWESLRQDPEIKATMEEVDKSYKLFKKIENLIVSDLEAKLAELKGIAEKESLQHFKLLNYDDVIKNLKQENDQLKQQLDEKDAEVQSWKDGTMVVKLGKLEEELAEKNKEISQLYPFVKEYDNGTFVEYNVIYEKGGIVATTTFGRNKEMAYEYLKTLREDVKVVSQNQTAIVELEKVKDKISYYLLKFDYFTPKQLTQVEKMIKAIDQQIKELKGGM